MTHPAQGTSSFGGEMWTPYLACRWHPLAVRMVLVEGEKARRPDRRRRRLWTSTRPPTRRPSNAADQVVSAILGTQEGAAESGYQVRSTGVTWDGSHRCRCARGRIGGAQGRERHAGVVLFGRRGTGPGRRQLRGYAQTGCCSSARHRDAGRGQQLGRAITDVHRQPLTPGADSVAELATFVVQRRLVGRPARRPLSCRIRRGHHRHQAAVGGGDRPDRECARGAGDGAGPRRGAGVGQRATLLVVHRCARLRARPRHRLHQPVRGRARILRRRHRQRDR